MTIRELTDDFVTLYHYSINGDIDDKTYNDTFESLVADLKQKANGYADVLTQMQADDDTLKAEIDRLTERRKVIGNNIKRLKKALETAMITTGNTKFKTDFYSFSIAKTPAALKLDEVDVMELPAEFITFAKPEINKAAVKEALKNGAVLDWARLESGESLRIK